METQQTSKNVIIAILVLATSVSIMSTDMYAPSLPDLTGYFGTSATMVKLTISLNLLAYGLAQLIHGPLSDRYGRRPVLLVSVFFVILLCIACALAQTIGQLLVARILLGIAAAAEAVVGFAIIKDRFTAHEQVKVLALFGMVLAIAPAIAPIFGGYMHVQFGWQSNFYVLAGLAALTLVVIYNYLQETATLDRRALQLARLIGGYVKHIKNAEFMVHSAMCGIAMGLIFVFVTGAPFVYMELLNVQTQHYGYYQAGIVLAFFLGSLLASAAAEHVAHYRLLQLATVLVLLGACLVVLLISLDLVTANRYTAATAIMTFGMGPLFAVAPSRAMRSISEQTGSASALLSGTEQCLAAFSALLISVFHDGTAKPMSWVTILMALCLLGLLLASRHISSTDLKEGQKRGIVA